jgi:hypothetical protein
VADCSASTPVEDEIRVLVVNSMLAPGLGRRNEMACMEACGVIEITCGMKGALRRSTEVLEIPSAAKAALEIGRLRRD